MCALVSGLALGQIANTQIKMPAGDSIISMVSVSDVSGVQNSYLLVTTYDKNVFLGQLDNNTPQGLYNNFFDKFQLPSTHTGYFFNGAFVDYDGNIVAYGYCDSDYKGLIVIYNMNTNGTHATSIDYSISSVSYTNILDGCCARLTNNGKVYGFVSNDKFMRIPFRNENSTRIVKNFGAQYTSSMSISFDDFSSKFVLSGTRQSSFFLGTFSNALTILNNVPFNVYTLPSNYISSEYTSKHVLSGNELYSDGIAYMVQDLRNITDPGNSFDGILVMKIDYINNSVIGSMGYKFGGAKVSIHDIAHNFDYLYVLGHNNGNYPNTPNVYESRYLAQINLYDSTDILTYHLKTEPHVYFSKYSHNSFLNNIIFNQYTYLVQATGAYNSNGYLTECYDLNYNECDSLVENALMPVNYTTSSSCVYTNSNITSIWGIAINATFPWTNTLAQNSRYFWTVDECSSGLYYDYESLIADTKMRLSDKIEVPITEKSVSADGEIDVLEENSFVCSKFNGNCKYIVYDIQGRVVNEGATQNGNTNYLNGLIPGLYLIRVTDSNNGFATKKIVVN